MNRFLQLLEGWLQHAGVNQHIINQLDEVLKLMFIMAIAALLWLVLNLIRLLIKKRLLSHIKFGTSGKEQLHTILKLAINTFILLFVYQLLPTVFPPDSKFSTILLRGCAIAIIIYTLRVINCILKIGFHLFSRKDKYRQRPLKGFMQIIQLILYFIGGILIVAALINKSPMGLLTGLGAFAAVLSFIFKDTILGFVAGIQLSYNDMIRPGDWIVVDNMANGVVTDMNLISVTVQNWDNTIVSVPTYSLINTQFQNWRGMDESDGRRITLNFNIDAGSIHFCSPQELEEMGQYIQLPENHAKAENEENLSGRKLKGNMQITNLELYRMYLLKMLLNNGQINRRLTFMVRYLQPGPYGVPLQIYCFSKNKSWVTYEAIQAAILEKALASAQMFNITIYQVGLPQTLQGQQPA